MYDVVIIGGGPIGLNAAIECGKRNYKTALIDSLAQLGGQLVALYPEKEIVDIPNITSIKAKDYIKTLQQELSKYHNVEIFLNEKITHITSEKYITLKCKEKELSSKKVIIATGLGAFIPRKMGVESEDLCSNILYSLDDVSFLKNKYVLVLGGGDSAIDWTKEISRLSDNVTLIHRRNEFRGDISTLKSIHNIKIMTPYIPYQIEQNNSLITSLTIKNVENNELIKLPCDYVFVNYGFISANEFFGLENYQGGIVVNEKMESSMKNVYAIGDIARYENKVRRIAPALKELEIVISSLG